MNGTWIILSNAVGEIDREFVLEGDDLNLALKDLLETDWSILDHGDQIMFVEGWSEG